jgi:hypothetical protein
MRSEIWSRSQIPGPQRARPGPGPCSGLAGGMLGLRPDQWLKEKLRLRDLDCPEMATPEGRAAQRFTAALVARATAVTVCTTKPDKYDRYLADVYLATEDGEKFLNNELLAAGHAVVKRAWEFGDWGA